MAVRMMCKKDEPGAVLDTYWTKEGTGEIWMKTTHEGLVVGLREHNWHDDSDFYAVVWNPEKGHTEEVMYGTTRFWTYPNCAAVDATPEVKAAYEAELKKVEDDRRAYWAKIEAKKPYKGRKVKAVRDVRGKAAVKAGMEGVVFWYGEDRFAKPRYHWHKATARTFRVGVETEGRKVFTAEDAWEAVDAA